MATLKERRKAYDETNFFKGLTAEDMRIMEFYAENRRGEFKRCDVQAWHKKKYLESGFREQDFDALFRNFYYNNGFSNSANKLCDFGFLNKQSKNKKNAHYSARNPMLLDLWFAFFLEFKKNLKIKHYKKAVAIAENIEKNEKKEEPEAKNEPQK
jgi:hypothetical protein